MLELGRAQDQDFVAAEKSHALFFAVTGQLEHLCRGAAALSVDFAGRRREDSHFRRGDAGLDRERRDVPRGGRLEPTGA